MKQNVLASLFAIILMLMITAAKADICTDIGGNADYWGQLTNYLAELSQRDYSEQEEDAAATAIADQINLTRQWADYLVAEDEYLATEYGYPLHQLMNALEKADDWETTFYVLDQTTELLFVAANECAQADTVPAVMEQPRGGMNVIYMPPPEDPLVQQLIQRVQASQTAEVVTEIISDLLVLPFDLPVYFANCGTANAYYDPGEKRITMCYEYLVLVASLFASDERSDTEVEEAVIGVATNVLLHEIGHALVDIFEIPITGREEDAVDSLAALILLGGEQSDMLFATMLNWSNMAMVSGEVSGELLTFHGEHSLNSQRFYDLACLVFGSDPEQYMRLVADGWLPESRAVRCPAEFEQKNRAWDVLLEPYYAE